MEPFSVAITARVVSPESSATDVGETESVRPAGESSSSSMVPTTDDTPRGTSAAVSGSDPLEAPVRVTRNHSFGSSTWSWSVVTVNVPVVLLALMVTVPLELS